VVAWCVPLAAQGISPSRSAEKEKEPPASAETKEILPRRVEEVQPAVFYLKDKQGNLQAVPNFTLEDFEELYRFKNHLEQGNQPPRYSLQQMLATGYVNAAGQAELSIQFHIMVRDAQWTRIPLRLDQAVLCETALYQGPGEHFLSFEGEGVGYVVWIRGTAGQQHQVTLKVLVPLARMAQVTWLRLQAPRATESKLKLKAPYANVVAQVSEGATLQTPGGNGKEPELTVVPFSGDFEMSWHPADAASGKAAALEAYGTIAARLDGRGVETEATFSVRSHGETFDRFRIRLPPRAELVPGRASGYTVTAIRDDSTPSGPGRQQLVEVQLAKRTLGPVEVRLSTKQSANRASAASAVPSDAWLELAGFDFPEAARQWGTIAVSVAGDWQVLWGSSRGVRQVDQLPEALRRNDTTAGFEYFAQPASLMARLAPRKKRIGVEPEYVLLIDSDQVRLEARFHYTVRGAKVFAVDIAMPDWQVDEVGPDSVVAVNGVPTGAAGPELSLPLVSPTIGQFDVRLKAHRLLPPEAESLAVALPQPHASVPAAAIVAVLPADNVEVLPDSRRTTGLLRQQAAVPLDLPLRQQEPLFYRSDAPQAVFAAELHRYRQKITASVTSRVMMDPAGGRVEEKLAYTIAYEPTDYFLLEVPRELSAKGRLVLYHEDQALVPVELSREVDDGIQPLHMRVSLAKACIGPCEITARYSLPPPVDGAATLHVPLVMPSEVELAGNSVLVTPAAEQQVEVAGDVWAVVEGGLGQATSPRTREFSAAQAAAEIALNLHGESGDAAVVVDQAWFQTCVTRSTAAARQDRAVLQLTTRRRELQITLPDGAVYEQASVQSHGTTVNPEMKAGRVLVMPLPAEAESPHYTLYLQYHFPEFRASRGAMRFDFPSLGDDIWIRRAYWQLLLPPEEHLVTPPRGMTGEFTWGWNGFYFGRQPVLNEADWDAWVRLPHPGNALVPAGMNVYLFSSMGQFGPCEIVTAGRSTIVFLSSGIALLAGLLLIYVRAARHPVVLLVATVLLAGLAGSYPELALIAAQASSIGVALALLAVLLRQLTAGSRPVLSEGSSAAAPIQPPPPSEPPLPAAAAGSSTATVLPMPPDVAT